MPDMQYTSKISNAVCPKTKEDMAAMIPPRMPDIRYITGIRLPAAAYGPVPAAASYAKHAVLAASDQEAIGAVVQFCRASVCTP